MGGRIERFEQLRILINLSGSPLPSSARLPDFWKIYRGSTVANFATVQKEGDREVAS